MSKGYGAEVPNLMEVFGEMLESDLAKELGRGDKKTFPPKESAPVAQKDVDELSERFNGLFGKTEYSENDKKFAEIVDCLNEELRLNLEDKIPSEFLFEKVPCDSKVVEEIFERCQLEIGNYLNKLVEAHKMTIEKETEDE